jgi:Fe-S-cluster-containing hydrogenase component 2
MRYLKIDLSKCGAGANCNFECEAACAKKSFKSGDQTHSAIKMRQIVDQDGSVKRIEVVCNQCGDCIKICPSSALARNRIGAVMINKEACVGCYMCVGFCESGTFYQQPGELDPFKCKACGTCVKACPHSALEIIKEPAAEGARQQRAEENP